MSTTINGLASIRAYRAQAAFIDQFFDYQNDHMSTLMVYLYASKAMGAAMSVCCGLFVCAITAVVMLLKGLIQMKLLLPKNGDIIFP